MIAKGKLDSGRGITRCYDSGKKKTKQQALYIEYLIADSKRNAEIYVTILQGP